MTQPRRLLRPRTFLVVCVAIVNILVGSMGVLQGLLGVGLMIYVSRKTGAGSWYSTSYHDPGHDLPAYMNEQIPGYNLYQVLRAMLGLVLGIVLISAAVRSLCRSPWARSTALSYSILTILLHSSYLFLQLWYVIPAVQQWAPDNPNLTPVMVGAFVASVLYIGHAGLLLIVEWSRYFGTVREEWVQSSAIREEILDVIPVAPPPVEATDAFFAE